MKKSFWLSLLVCVNLLLLTAIILTSYSLPTALAQQPAGLADNFMIATGEIQNEYDALYVLDLKERTLHTFYYDKGRRRLYYSDFRDLERDFRNNRD
ncbi:hypothetical protein RAS1_26940 [Phycisphaerae bacterium RAS1]|nr:hypothetical protein RAS1_26940 [Phycisphaerae bacterium RAS1]